MFWLLLVQIVLIMLNAIFASAEIAVLSMNETALERMANDGNKKAKRLFRLTREPAKFLATIQVAITLSGFLGSAFAADSFSEPLVAWVQSLGVTWNAKLLDTIAVILITLVLSYFTLVFGELVPKRIAMKRSEKIAMSISGMVSGISVVFKPIVWFLSVSTNLVLRLFGIDPSEKDDDVSEEEIIMMVDAGSEQGTIDDHEKEFIQNIFEFNDITAADIATHRSDVTYLKMSEDDDAWAKTIKENIHTLYPVCEETADDIVCVLNAKEYFRLDDKSRENVIANATHSAYFVPENVKADVLFKNMKANRKSMAIVIDEYGGMTGIVTFSDLIEELLGEINDSPEGLEEEEGPHLEKIEEDTWLAVGNVRLEDFEDKMGLVIESEDYDTLAGVVFDALGSIPDDGEQDIEVELDFATVTVKRVESHQLEESIVKIKGASEPLDEESESE